MSYRVPKPLPTTSSNHHNVTDKAFVVRVVLDSTDSPLLTSEGHVQVGVFAVSAE